MSVANNAAVSEDLPAVSSTDTAVADGAVPALPLAFDKNVSLAPIKSNSSAVQTEGRPYRCRPLLQPPRHRRQPNRTHLWIRLRKLQPLP